MAGAPGEIVCNVRQLNHTLLVLDVDWRADKITGEVDILIPERIEGRVLCVDTVPSVAIPPDDLYDPVLLNTLWEDIMGGALADRSQMLAQRAWPSDGVASAKAPVHECLWLTIFNNTQGWAMGKMKIYYERRT